MDKTQLKNFVLLAQTLNYSRVAAQQFISQPALTKQIVKLENELGVKLFNRTKQGVSLTNAGLEFYGYAKRILDDYDEAERRMAEIGRGHTGSIKISTIPGMEFQVCPVLNEFHKRYENISISIDYATGTKQIMNINEKSHDIYFSFSSLLEASGALSTHSIRPDRFAIYISEDYAKEMDKADLLWLNHLPGISESRADGPFLITAIVELMEKLGLRTDNMIFYPNSDAIFMAIQAGLGYAILPSRMNHGVAPEGVRIIPIMSSDAVIENSIGWHIESENLAVRKFLEVFSELQGLDIPNT